MKKSIFPFLIATSFFSVIFSNCEAQFVMNSRKDLSVNESAIFSESGIPSGANVNSKAEKNFVRTYQQATAVDWSALQDNSWVCRFNMNNISYKAYYGVNGQWLGTVSSYDGNKLNQSTRDRVKRVYYNYRIVFVNEVNLAKDRIIYIVEIQDEKSVKKIRIASDEDEMEVVQQFER